MLRTSFVAKNILAGLLLGLSIGQPVVAASEQTDSIEALKESAKLGNALAQLKLGAMYYAGQGVKQSYTDAAKWLRKATDQGVLWHIICSDGCTTRVRGATKL